jgi:hypothetical protein
MPAKAGIQRSWIDHEASMQLDSRVRGNDEPVVSRLMSVPFGSACAFAAGRKRPVGSVSLRWPAAWEGGFRPEPSRPYGDDACQFRCVG